METQKRNKLIWILLILVPVIISTSAGLCFGDKIHPWWMIALWILAVFAGVLVPVWELAAAIRDTIWPPKNPNITEMVVNPPGEEKP